MTAADGIVTFVEDSSNTGGSNPMYWDYTLQPGPTGIAVRNTGQHTKAGNQ